jgi:HEAT repeat protein
VLGDLDPQEARDALAACLRDEDAGVRATAIASLARDGNAAALAPIIEGSDDPDPSVRRATVEAIASLGVRTGPASGAVARLTHDADPGVRSRAAAVLVAATGDPEASTALADLARDEAAEVRALAFGAMHGLHAPQLFDVASAALTDPVPAVRAEAAGAVATLDPARALDPLVGALADDQPLVRDAVARALGVLGAPAVAPVAGALASPDRRDGALAALEHLPLNGRTEAVRAFAVAMVAEAVESHRLSAGIDDVADARLALLRDSLRWRSERQAVLALRAAALESGIALSVALENLSVADPAQRANALEVIESVGAREIVRPLLSMWDGSPVRIDRDALLERLRDDPDGWIRACTELAMEPRSDDTQGGTTMTRTMDTLSPMERVLFLRDVPLFSELPPPDLMPIAVIAEEHAYADGDVIGVQGEPGESMHVIVSGDVSVVTRDPDAHDREVAVRSRGEVVGEMAVITHEPRIASLVARGDVRVLTISRPQFEAILRERPETALGVIRVLSQRLASATG